MGDIQLKMFAVVGIATLLYSLAEIAYAIYAKSLLMLSDGFHNLADVMGLMIAYWARMRYGLKANTKMTYGWRRVEPLGALVNSCSLVSLGVFLFLEAISKFLDPSVPRGGLEFIIVASIGIAVNGIGAALLGYAGLHHHDHGTGRGHSRDHNHGGANPGMNLNILAAFLHYAIDALTSVALVATGIVYLLVKGSWVAYLDPAVTLVVVLIIVITSIPVIKKCIGILLNATPKGVDISSIKSLIRSVTGVQNVHDLHVWELNNAVSVASVHIEADDEMGQLDIHEKVREIFHDSNVHSTTIQLEVLRPVLSVPQGEAQVHCRQLCVHNCSEDKCCKDE